MVGTDNGTAICDLSQNCHYFLLIFKDQMPHIKSMKNIQQDKIKNLCLDVQVILFGKVEASNVIRWFPKRMALSGHTNFKIHTGEVMPLGKGSVIELYKITR